MVLSRIGGDAVRHSQIYKPAYSGFSPDSLPGCAGVFMEGCQMKEIWKECCEGFYEVSNLGRVRRLKSARGTAKGRLLKLSLTPNGYPKITTSIDGKYISRQIHRLVAEAFLGPCPPGRQVNHKDGDKTNNNATNLEWTTQSENCYHALGLGLSRVKYPQTTIDLVRSLHKSGVSLRKIAKQTGVGAPYCSRITRGLRRTVDWAYDARGSKSDS